MKVIRSSGEAEMIAEFLRQEYASRERYGVRLDACLRDEAMSPRLITDPVLTNQSDNAQRRRLFGRYRGYGSGEPSYLTGFPSEGVAWSWANLSRDEMLRVRYIRYRYWTALSAGTRSPTVAAARIRAGIEVYGVSNAGFLGLADRLREGLRVPPLILATALVTAADADALVVMEGHARLTAFALAPEAIPDELEVLVGASPAISRWDEY